jgi:phosphoribosyl 1,2-cyclic phosphate phosphodiesterase
LTISEATSIAKELSPKRTYLTHMNHDVLHAEAEKRLPPNVRLAYDGLTLSL